MSSLTESAPWKALAAHRARMGAFDLRAAFTADPGRFTRCSLGLDDMLVDYSKNLVDEETIALLIDLARHCGLPAWIERMFRGEQINATEGRAALHTALRGTAPVFVDGKDVMLEVARVLGQMREFSAAVRAGRHTGHRGGAIRDVVNIGIGGSYLGPALAAAALEPYAAPGLGLHFVSNIDGALLDATLGQIDPGTTLFIVASKTFTTQETLVNARSARRWLVEKLGEERAVARHFVAVSSNYAAAAEFGIARENVFEFWDWVGGRYSLWSAIGLPVAIYLGMERFDELRAGAHAIDEHFRRAPLERNLPVILGLLDVWYVNFFGAASRVVLPYAQSLALLPSYLQQLEMESNGKRITRDGSPVDYDTGAVVWGEPGTNGQHAFYQLLHQGTRLIPADFIAACRPHHALSEHHSILLANFLAQTEALMRGKSAEEVRGELAAQGMSEPGIARHLPHRVFPGNRPSTSIVLRRLDPRTLGALIALYEHRVFVQSVIWNVNAFDQWGVELGKRLAGRILPELSGNAPVSTHDASTNGLINHCKSQR
ncbi:MAG: glucose-6-phosphate isomerase [Betaproteobacteria bacterium]|nr:glucose-6-phosphate isomerase [Betaproteobacteria bacterium]